jgi:hypothetical protein
MGTREPERGDGDRRADTGAAAPQAAAPEKKAYRQPVLSKYEQWHGIGLGGPV